MKASGRYKIATREMFKANFGNAFKTLFSSTDKVFSQGGVFFEMGKDKEDIFFSYSSLNDALKAYEKCPPIATVIEKKTQAHLNGKTWILNNQGKAKDKESTSEAAIKLRALLAKPNPVQSWSQFEAQAKVFMELFGYCPVLAIVPVGFPMIDAKQLWILPPWLLEIEEHSDMFYLTRQKSLIKSIKINYKGRTSPLDVDSVFFLKENSVSTSSLVLPESKIKVVKAPVNNIIGAYISRSVLIKRRGALGILSNGGTKDQGFTIPLDQTEKEEVQKELKRYGLQGDQWQIIVTSASLQWQQMGYPTKELMLFEEVEDSTKAICDRFGFPFRLLSYYTGGSLSGNDAKEFKQSLYQDTIIPEAGNIYSQLNEIFELSAYGIRLEKDFSHLPVLQKDEKDSATARKTRNEALEKEWRNGMITLNEWRVKNNEDPVGGDDRFNMYFPEYVQKYGDPQKGLANIQIGNGDNSNNSSEDTSNNNG